MLDKILYVVDRSDTPL